jgi:putative salt-induced outer membrane protein YdiY
MRLANKQSLHRAAACALAILLTGTSIVGADEFILHLKNGDRITGTIVQENGSELTVTNALVGKLSVPLNQIERREKAAPKVAAPVLAQPSPTTNAPAVAPNPPAATTGSPAPVPPAPAKTAPPPPPVAKKPTAEAKPADKTEDQPSSFLKFLQAWRGDVQIGANLAFSTKERQTFTGRIKATHSSVPFGANGQMRNVVDYNATYGTTEGVLSDNQMDGSWKVEYDIGKNKRFHVYNAAGAGYNEIQKIDLRYDLGPGIGYKVLVLTNFVLKTELGGNYQRQIFSNDTSKERYAMRFAEDFTWQISRKIKFDQKIEFFPQVEDFGNYRIRGEGNLSFLLKDNVTFTLNVIDIYDTALPADVSKNDLQIRSLIGIKF